MKPTAATIAEQSTSLDEQTIETHLGRLDADYFERFEPPAIARHIDALASLSAEYVVDVTFEALSDGAAACTVIAFDHPFEFSLIAGVLAGTGFRIDRGEVFTLRKVSAHGADGDAEAGKARRLGFSRAGAGRRFDRRPGARPGAHGRRVTAPPRTAMNRRVIIDHFVGRVDSDQPFDEWSAHATQCMTDVLTLLDKGDDASVAEAKQRVNKMVTQRLAALQAEQKPMLYPVEMAIDQLDDATRLTVIAQDTPAFLYSLSFALSLRGLSIERLHIGSEGDRVKDQIHVVDKAGQPLRDPKQLEQVRLSVLLTKQFTYFLDSSPDPFSALTRFEQMTEQILSLPEHGQWVDLLENPRAMQELAKLLGASDFLWEDFIRQQYESLLPILKPHLTEGERFCQPRETVPLRLAQALEPAVGLAEQQHLLNKFKDQEIFLIDLDHILTPGADFKELSERLTLLAENLVAVAARCVYDDLVKSYGHPMRDKKQRASYAVFGLGKLGGVALGYASDIELLFVYGSPADASMRTTGGKREAIANSEFYEKLVTETSQFIKTKRKGIFETDLRLRPYGNDGPKAVSIEQFRNYYRPGGDAHPFEKLALVRLRWIAGNAALGFDVTKLRDAFVYEDEALDTAELLRVWGKQRQEKSEPGKLNAKYSPGALTDLEGTVQLLQLRHARSVPQLHTPRLSSAMEALRRADVLTPREFADLYGAYHFLRRLINALRMLRGHAQDLFLPPAESDEYVHLARRMGYKPRGGLGPAEQLSQDFEQRTEAVRAFVEKHFE